MYRGKYDIGYANVHMLYCSRPGWITMMTQCHRNPLLITGPLWGESTDHRLFPSQSASNMELWCFFMLAWTTYWTNSRVDSDLRLHYAHASALWWLSCMCIWVVQRPFETICLHDAMLETRNISWPYVTPYFNLKKYLINFAWIQCVKDIYLPIDVLIKLQCKLELS